MSIYFRDARLEDLEQLSAIAHAAKAHWDYPPEWLALWKDDLTITAEHLDKLRLCVVYEDDTTIGFHATTLENDVCEIHHMWLSPAHIGRGIGREMFASVVDIARYASCQEIEVLSDPYAEPFYQKMGLTRVLVEPSSIPGRSLPRLRGTLVYCECNFDCECQFDCNFERVSDGVDQ